MSDDGKSRRQRKALTELRQSIEASLGNADARKMLRWVLDLCEVYVPDVDNGRRQVGLDIIAMLNEISPHSYVGLMKEGADDVVRMRNAARGDETDAD